MGPIDKKRALVHCPRCIKGTMYLDNKEYVCLQCGCVVNPSKVKLMPQKD